MKKKLLVGLLLLPLLCTPAQPKSYTNKTFMMPRSVLDNLPLQVSSWHTQVMKQDKNKFAGSIQAVGFYQASDNKSNLGKYFGYYAKQEEKKRDYISVAPLTDPNNIDFTSDDIPVIYIYHDPDLNPTIFGGQIKFKPSQEVYGVRLDYYQNLHSFYFKVDLPIVEVKNSMGVSKMGNVPLTSLFGVPTSFYNLFDYFEGDIENLNNQASPNQAQKKLTHAKFGDTQDKSGVADINVSLGYTFLNKRSCRAGLGVNVTIPTGNEAHGEWLFEPILGNGKHWGLGCELDSKLRLWDEGTGSRDAIDFLFFANLKYLFDNTEHRTLGLLDNEGNKIKFGQYYLAGKKGELPVFPLANVLTRKVSVDPGLQFEMLAGLAFSANNVTFDLGYNMFVKNCEDVHLKEKWEEDTYAIAHPGYPGVGNAGYETVTGLPNPQPNDGPFNPSDPHHYDSKTIPGPITHENLDIDAARTPSVLTHKVYGALNYAFYEWKYPLMLGIGGSYEFDSGNAALEGYDLWVKASVSF
jgi:hypothetical protein